jgi:Tol biopolymer transport system component
LPGSVVLTDIRSGASKVVNLPRTIRPSSPVEVSGSAAICLDFSPDSRYIVFSASPRSAEQDSAVETFRDLAGKSAKESDIYILDLQTGNCFRLTNDGKSYDPVWKGR